MDSLPECEPLSPPGCPFDTTKPHISGKPQNSFPLFPNSGTEPEPRIRRPRNTSRDVLLSRDTLQTIPAPILPPHPARVCGTGNQAENCGSQVHPAGSDVPRSFGCNENVAGDEACGVGNRDEHGAGEGASVEVGDVGDDPRVIDG